MTFSESVKSKREALAVQIILLLRQLNELTQPARLPPELLSEIFANIAPYEPKKGTSYGVMKAAQVCHLWREVALQDSQLWTHIETDCQPDYMRMMLERSGQCLLDVTCMKTRDTVNFKLLWSQIHRTRSVVLSEILSAKHYPLQNLDAPHLETFIDNTKFASDPPLLSILHAPRLRRVKVLPSSVPLLHSLQFLTHVELCWRRRPLRIRAAGVMKALGSLPLLTHLYVTIGFDLASETPQVPEECPVVSLDKLKSFEFGEGSDIVGAAFFLAHIILPSSIRIEGNFDSGNAHLGYAWVRQTLSEGVATLLERWPAGSTISELRLHFNEMRDNEDPHFGISASADQPTETWQEARIGWTHPLELEFPDVFSLRLPSFPRLHLLSVNTHWRRDHLPELHRMFMQLDGVENLALCNLRFSRKRYSPARWVDINELLMGTNAQMFFPNLSTLKLYNIHFVSDLRCLHCTYYGQQFADNCNCGDHYHQLVAWLKKRRDIGRPVARVVFERCNDMTEDQKSELERLVARREVFEVENHSEQRRQMRKLRKKYAQEGASSVSSTSTSS